MSSTLRFASSLSTRASEGGTGTASLVQLENQILTLRSTILAVIPLGEATSPGGIKDSAALTLDAPYGDVESSTSTGLTPRASVVGGKNIPVGGIVVEAQDFTNLQQEYNKLMFKKHEVWSRSFLIPKAFIGLSFQVHNGSKLVLLKVTAKMVGYRFGEFVPSRKVTIHKEAKKKK